MQEQFVDVNGIRTRFFMSDGGHKETLLLLHDGAWGASADITWGQLFASMTEKFNVVAHDMPGFGGTDKLVYLDRSPYDFRIAHAIALLDRLGIDGGVHWIGQSFGGSVALRSLTADAARGRVASVTTIAGTGGPWRTELAARELGSFDGTEARLREILGFLSDEYAGQDDHVHSRMAWAKAPGHYQSMMAPHGAVPKPLKIDRGADPYPANLAQVTTPVLLIHGEKDQLVDAIWVDKLSEALSHSQVVRMNTKHSPNLDHPAATWAAIETFLTGI